MWPFWIDQKPILHVIDRETRYSAAKYMKFMSAEHSWDSIIEFRITFFTVFPPIIAAGRQSFIRSKWFETTCYQLGIYAKIAATENHNSVGLFERYHSLIRRIFNALRLEHPEISNEKRLPISTHAVNNTAGPEGITPTVLLFGTTPRYLPPEQKARFEAMKTARTEM